MNRNETIQAFSWSWIMNIGFKIRSNMFEPFTCNPLTGWSMMVVLCRSYHLSPVKNQHHSTPSRRCSLCRLNGPQCFTKQNPRRSIRRKMCRNIWKVHHLPSSFRVFKKKTKLLSCSFQAICTVCTRECMYDNIYIYICIYACPTVYFISAWLHTHPHTHCNTLYIMSVWSTSKHNNHTHIHIYIYYIILHHICFMNYI